MKFIKKECLEMANIIPFTMTIGLDTVMEKFTEKSNKILHMKVEMREGYETKKISINICHKICREKISNLLTK